MPWHTEPITATAAGGRGGDEGGEGGAGGAVALALCAVHCTSLQSLVLFKLLVNLKFGTI